jgi:hypothetical protein
VDRSGTIDEKEFVELCKYVILEQVFFLLIFFFPDASTMLPPPFRLISSGPCKSLT